MDAIIEKLKVNTAKKPFKKNTTSERQKEFANYFSWVKLTSLCKFYNFNCLDLPLVLHAKFIKEQCQIRIKSINFLCNFLDKFIFQLIQVNNAGAKDLGNIYYLYLSPSYELNRLRKIWLYLFLLHESKIGADCLEWYVNYQHLSGKLRRIMSLGVETESASIYENISRENLNKILTNSNLCDNCISYLDSLCKPIARYFIPVRAGFNKFYRGTDRKFRIAKFQRVQISELLDSNGYKIIVADKEVSFKGVLKSFVKNLLIGEAFVENDVMKLLLTLDSQIGIVPILPSASWQK
jgi:hypothetical protein